MKVPSIDNLKKIAGSSILNITGRAASKSITEKGVGPGRYSHGVHIEDVAYLITRYLDAVEHRLVQNGRPYGLSDLQSLVLQQLIGIPAKKVTRGLNNDAIAAKLEEYFNKLQNEWRFTFTTHATHTGNMLKYSVMDVGLIGGNELGLGGLFDL